MPVTIHFRGLILFRFPKEGGLIAEMISNRTNEPKTAIQPRGPRVTPEPNPPHAHHHQAEVQILSENGNMLPVHLGLDSRLDIVTGTRATIDKTDSYLQHVPRLSTIVQRADRKPLATNTRNRDYLRSTVTVDQGRIRVKDVVIWDASGFPLGGAKTGETPARPAELKFMGCDLWGHMANQCSVDIDTDEIELRYDPGQGKPGDPNLSRPHRPLRSPNAYTSPGTIEILISNFEFERGTPVPWGLDFQWLFGRAGYAPVDLDGPEFARLDEFGKNYQGGKLWSADMHDLLNDSRSGFPFPYLVHNPLLALRPLTQIDSRPVCVPGEDDTTTGGH